MIDIGTLKTQFNDRVALREKRPGTFQLFAPFYHEDGDMLDIFLEETGNGRIRVCDHAMTLMRLSYSFDIDSPNKEKILNTILSENGLQEQDGNLWIEATPDNLYSRILHFSQTIGKVSSMSLYKREFIHSLFFEMLDEIVNTKLARFKPHEKYYPLPDQEEYEVDYCFNGRNTPSYLLGVNSSAKAQLATISCLKFQKEEIRFRSIIVIDDLDGIAKKIIKRLMSAADKQFPSLEDFKENGEKYLERESAYLS